MPRRRNRLNWLHDNDLQQFTTPTGRVISLHEIAALLQDQVTCSHDFQGPRIGWRMRQNRLIAPGAKFSSSAITPQTLRAFTRWLASYEDEQAQLEFHTVKTDQQNPTLAPNTHAIAIKTPIPRCTQSVWVAATCIARRAAVAHGSGCCHAEAGDAR
jgi:hypothetical protein